MEIKAYCKMCGKPYMKRNGKSLFCSDACKKARIKQRYEAEKEERKAYAMRWREEHPDYYEQYKKKAPNYERDRWRKIRGSQEYTKECIVCGKTFKTWYPQKQTCSDECKKINNDRKHRERGKNRARKRDPEKEHAKWIKCRYGSEEAHQEYLAELEKKKQEQMEQTRKRKEAEKKAKLIFGECVVCGNSFKTYNRQQKTCSKECGKKLSYARKQKRIPENQIVDKDITLEALYRRDSGVCYLCGKLCDWNDKEGFVVGASYPSIDHIVPVSRGGLHAWNNVRLAHFRCNVDKSDEIIPEAKKMIPKNAYEFKRDVKPRKKKTLQFTKDNQFLAEYESTAEAERQTGTKQRGIQKCASGQCKSYGGFIWRYA